MISVPPRSETLAHLHDDHRWHLVRRLLHDNDLPLEDRVAGLLLLLYAQPRVQLLLSAKPLDLPPPLDDLVRDLTARRHGRAVLGRTSDHPWLVPGGAPGQPITGRHLRLRLRPLGIPARASRNTALIDLAAQVPAVVLSRLLDIHINTATSWAQHAASSPASYAAHVTHRQAPSKSRFR